MRAGRAPRARPASARPAAGSAGSPRRRTKQRDGWERPDGTAPTGRPPALYLFSGGIARCGNCGGPLTVATDNQGHKRYRCDRRGRDQCSRGVSIRVADLDAIVTERFLSLAGDLYAADVQEVTTAPDAGVPTSPTPSGRPSARCPPPTTPMMRPHSLPPVPCAARCAPSLN
ncbi:zinc ribbon domain-containing protein [Micromonospora sp. NBC_01638]|uniref:zinc ribbon domain-containing protein n=1 Tax=Micromonospora sp. NBC_01638 TaxID=2975982 RepID=UPI003868E241